MRNKFLRTMLFVGTLVGAMVVTSEAALAAIRLVNVDNTQASGAVCTYEDQRLISFSDIMPKALHLAAENGRDLSNEIIRLEGGETRYLQVMVSDADGDGTIGDQGDFETYGYSRAHAVSADISIPWSELAVSSADASVATPELAYASLPAEYQRQVESGLTSNVQIVQSEVHASYGYYARLLVEGTTAAVNAVIENENWQWLREQIPSGANALATLKITGVQQAGTESDAFNPENARISYTMAYGTEEPDAWPLNPTAFTNVVVYARDMGSDDGDNGGGSCGLGLGGAGLLLACLALLRRRS